MPLIETVNKIGIEGEIKLFFSNKLKRFEIQVSKQYLSKFDNSLLYFTDYRMYKENLNQIVSSILVKTAYTRTVIFIKFKTSESVSDENHGTIFDHASERIYEGSGFVIGWWVFDEYEHINEFTKKRQLYYKEKECGNNTRSKGSKLEIKGQLFLGDTVRTLEYSDDLYLFLKSLDFKIASMCQQLMVFFDKDTPKFLENITNAGPKLLSK